MRKYQKKRTSDVSSDSNRPLIIFTLIVFLISAFIIAGSYAWRWLRESNSFPITHVRVEGKLVHETPGEILYLMQNNLSGGFFSLNVSAVKQAILALPWVADVSFRRIWPHTLAVRITEQKAVARFGKNGVLNTQGAVFYPNINSIPKNLPAFDGPVDQIKTIFNFYDTVNALAHLINLNVIALQVNAEQSWRLQLSNQVWVALGRHHALEKFQRFVTVYPKILAVSQQPMVSVDLRYTNGVAVQYQNQTPPAA